MHGTIYKDIRNTFVCMDSDVFYKSGGTLWMNFYSQSVAEHYPTT